MTFTEKNVALAQAFGRDGGSWNSKIETIKTGRNRNKTLHKSQHIPPAATPSMALGSSSSSSAEPQDSSGNNQNNDNSSNNRPILNPLPQSRDPPKPLTPLPLHHNHNSSTITTSNTSGYPSLQQPPPIYPVASSGRGFVRGNLRPPSGTDQTVTLANHGTVGYPPRSVVAFPHHIFRPLGFPHSDAGTHPVHLMRPPQYFGPVGGTVSAPTKGIPVLSHPKVRFPFSWSMFYGL